jgi:hypothetical protein
MPTFLLADVLQSGKEIIAAFETQDKLDSLLNISAGERHTVNL